MKDKFLSTDSYKGVRDFYPDDMAIQSYIFDVWSQTAESFGYERYDASVLEPAILYKSKGAENEELVNEQTYTFLDRGEREVTLRPEMTPTVARMVAGKRHELVFPLRWYSIPNLFRYERAQRGRLREHWQLNCDLFGADDVSADIEILALAHQMLINFGATEDMFEIKVNNRAEMTKLYSELGINDEELVNKITKLNDQKAKISKADYTESMEKILKDRKLTLAVIKMVEEKVTDHELIKGLATLGINNATIDRSIARGFDYYTGTVFEIFDKSPENNRALLGGGRYDNLTAMFGGNTVTGIGFGMGDVTMRDFLETHDLLTANITSPTIMVIPAETNLNIEAQKIAKQFREADIKVATDMSQKKVGKKISDAGKQFVEFALIFGEDELNSSTFTLKNLTDGTEQSGTLTELINNLTT
ncbi:histidine--tRNA ligase [Candidatus Kaiserbacteria bacterium]|nr:histidine--tRNA ligase [Candidatus Kaiserbacteria bacterium]